MNSDARVLAIRSSGGRRWKRGCLTAAAVVLGALALAAGGWAWHIRSRVAALRKHANALLAEREASRAPAAPEDDATPLYRQAFERLPDTKLLAALSCGEPPKPSPEARRLVADSAECLRLAEEAWSKPTCLWRYGLLGASVHDVRLPKVSDMPNLVDLVRLISLRAVCRAEDGDADGALDDALGILRVAGHVAQERSFVAHALAGGLAEGALVRLQALAAGGKLDEGGTVRAISEIDAQLRTMPGLADVLRGEKAEMIGMLARLAAGQPELPDVPSGVSSPVRPGLGGAVVGWLWRWSGSTLDDAQSLEEGFDRLTAAVKLPPDKRQASIAAFHAEQTVARREAGVFRLGRPFTFTVLPMLTAVADKLGDAHSKPLVCRTGLACHLYRLRRGAYPESLDRLAAEMPELVPAVPEDPCRAALLNYRRTAAGFRLWAVGTDGQDDGGTAPQDDVFEVGGGR